MWREGEDKEGGRESMELGKERGRGQGGGREGEYGTREGGRI